MYNKELAYFIYHVVGGRKGSTEPRPHRTKFWNFVPSYPDYIMKLSHLIEKLKLQEASLIDLGCGVSPVLLYLQLMHYKMRLTGVDINQRHLSQLKKYANGTYLYRLKLRKQDIRTVDLSGYKIIYLFMPFVKEKEYREFIRKTIDKMDSGSILVDFYALGHCKPKNIKLTRVEAEKFKYFYYQKP